jgi:hypothetical protein
VVAENANATRLRQKVAAIAIAKMETDSATTRRKLRNDKGAPLSGDLLLPERRGL